MGAGTRTLDCVFVAAGREPSGLGERQAEIYLPVIRMGGRGSCRAWLWIGRSHSLPVKTILPLALVAFRRAPALKVL